MSSVSDLVRTFYVYKTLVYQSRTTFRTLIPMLLFFIPYHYDTVIKYLSVGPGLTKNLSLDGGPYLRFIKSLTLTTRTSGYIE